MSITWQLLMSLCRPWPCASSRNGWNNRRLDSCRYSGSQQLQTVSPGPGTSDALSPGGELEGSIAQHLRRLAKRDPTTRLKALQVGIFSALAVLCVPDTNGLHEAASCNCNVAALRMIQALKPLLVDLPSAELESVLLAWTPNFQRLVMDNVR